MQEALFPAMKTLSFSRGMFTHREMMNKPHVEHFMISDEIISGYPFIGDYLGQFQRNIKRIKQLYGDPKIVFGIRKHDKFMLSLYKQFLHERGFQKIEYFYNIENTGLIKHHELFWAERIKVIKELFSDVFIYSQERLKESPQAFIDALFDFMDVDESIRYEDLPRSRYNVGVNSKLQVNTLRHLNRLNHWIGKLKIVPDLYYKIYRYTKTTPRDIAQHHLRFIKGKKYELTPELTAHLNTFYQSDWEEAKKQVSF